MKCFYLEATNFHIRFFTVFLSLNAEEFKSDSFNDNVFILFITTQMPSAFIKILANEVLMKKILKTFSLFIALSIAFSALTACSTASSNRQTQGVEKAGGGESGAETKTDGKPSDYPPAPDSVMKSEVKNINGTAFKLEDLKGKVLLLNMWATWCGPCREEMPHLVAMEDEFKSKDFKVVGLNIDQESTDLIVPFAEKLKLNYDLAWADEDLYKGLLKISKFDAIPQSFLIDRGGHLRGVFLGGSKKVVQEMRATVEKVVNE